MKRERLMILKLVETQKITTDEAVKLLNAMKGNSTTNHMNKDNFQKASQTVSEFTKDMGEKCSDLFETAEPAIKNASKTVATKVSGLLSDLSKTLNQTSNNDTNSNYSSQTNSYNDDDIIDIEEEDSSTNKDEVVNNVY